jgi:exodeoxyribonuclease VII large subunit
VIPVISAVGHETDFTICDFVADLRAPTPSAAAELAVPVRKEQELLLLQMENRLNRALAGLLDRQKQRLQHLADNKAFRQPFGFLDQRRLDCDRAAQNLRQAMQRQIVQSERHFSILAGKLDALSPLKVMARGYGVVTSPVSGRFLLSTALVNPGDPVDVWLSDGVLNCEVRQVSDRRYSG